MYTNDIMGHLQEARQTLDAFMNNPELIEKIEMVASAMAESIKSGGKILTCGNGGSQCDAMHFAEELTGKYREVRKALPAIAIADTSHITCVGNDFGFDYIFSRYVEALGTAGDVLLGISTSGNSANVINAVEAARAKGMKTIVLTGKSGGKLAEIADMEIRVAHEGYSDRVQEVHIKIIHILIFLIEKMIS